MTRFKRCVLAMFVLAFTATARAELGEINVAQQYGVAFLPLMLMERDKLTEAEAFRSMQRLAMDRRISMRQLAEAILLTDRIGG